MKKRKKEKHAAEDVNLTEEQRIEKNIKRKTVLIKRLKHDAIFKTVGFVLTMAVLFTFVFGITRARTLDMYPAVNAGDFIFYYRLGDVLNTDVVLYEAGDETRIGRVEATSGSKLGATEDGRLTIDGNFQPVQPESGMYYETYLRDGLAVPADVEGGQYLVLGDNRANAQDSRDYGLIDKKDIKGKVLVILRRRPL